MDKPLVGFIGQGWIGRSYADDFEARGYEVVRYALEAPYVENKEKIANCDIVLVAVPTPTTAEGFDDSILRSVLPLVGTGKIAVIKSTMRPGTTHALQEAFPNIVVMHAPEFLREANAAYDAAHPTRNLIGIVEEAHRGAAAAVLAVLPKAPYEKVMDAKAAELAKYAGNVFLAMKVVYANVLADFAEALEIPYEEVRDALAADPRVGPSHLAVLDASGHTDKKGRGAGGHCFIKDMEAFRMQYKELVQDAEGRALLAALVAKNNALLRASDKDIDLLEGVYGTKHDVLPRFRSYLV